MSLKDAHPIVPKNRKTCNHKGVILNRPGWFYKAKKKKIKIKNEKTLGRHHFFIPAPLKMATKRGDFFRTFFLFFSSFSYRVASWRLIIVIKSFCGVATTDEPSSAAITKLSPSLARLLSLTLEPSASLFISLFVSFLRLLFTWMNQPQAGLSIRWTIKGTSHHLEECHPEKRHFCSAWGNFESVDEWWQD